MQFTCAGSHYFSSLPRCLSPRLHAFLLLGISLHSASLPFLLIANCFFTSPCCCVTIQIFRRRAVPCSSDLCLSESRLFHSLATQLIASPFHRLAFPGSSLPILRISRPVLAMPLLYLSARLPARLCYATAILISPAHCLSFLPRPRQHNPRGNYPLKSYASLRYRCIFRNPATPQ